MPDSLVGNFRVGKEIGRGSFAVVFKGHHVVSCALCTPNSLLSFASGIIFSRDPLHTLGNKGESYLDGSTTAVATL